MNEGIRALRSSFAAAISEANGLALRHGHDPHPWRRTEGYSASTGCRVCGLGAEVTLRIVAGDARTASAGSLLITACTSRQLRP